MAGRDKQSGNAKRSRTENRGGASQSRKTGNNFRSERKSGSSERKGGFGEKNSGSRQGYGNSERRYGYDKHASRSDDRASGSAASSRNELLTGKNAVLARLESGGSVNQIWLSDTLRRDNKLQAIMDLAGQQKLKFHFVKRSFLDELTGDEEHQGVVADIPPYAYIDFEDLLIKLRGIKGKKMILVMDSIEDPHNAGAMIRSAVAAGVQAVIFPKHRNVQLTQTVARASAGTIEKMMVSRISNISKTLDVLKDAGYWVYGLAGEESSEDWNSQEFPDKLVLVVGNEGKGLGTLVRKHCDVLLKIPMLNDTESLNASVSAALMMYKIQEKRSVFN